MPFQGYCEPFTKGPEEGSYGKGGQRNNSTKARLHEYQSWVDNEVLELVDTRKLGNIANYVAGRWVRTLKRGKDGSFPKCKARCVLRGSQQTGSPAASRMGFRLAVHLAVNKLWDLTLTHIDLKTAFLQGKETRMMSQETLFVRYIQEPDILLT